MNKVLFHSLLAGLLVLVGGTARAQQGNVSLDPEVLTIPLGPAGGDLSLSVASGSSDTNAFTFRVEVDGWYGGLLSGPFFIRSIGADVSSATVVDAGDFDAMSPYIQTDDRVDVPIVITASSAVALLEVQFQDTPTHIELSTYWHSATGVVVLRSVVLVPPVLTIPLGPFGGELSLSLASAHLDTHLFTFQIEVSGWEGGLHSGPFFIRTDASVLAATVVDAGDFDAMSPYIQTDDRVDVPIVITASSAVALLEVQLEGTPTRVDFFTYWDSATATVAVFEVVDADGDGVRAGLDCDDTDPNNFPGNTEVCDLADNDCDAQIDNISASCSSEYDCANGALECLDDGGTVCSTDPGGSAYGGTCALSLDSDDDGLFDHEEMFGIPGVDLPGLGADRLVPDIFVEIDYMEDARPCEASIREVIQSFAAHGIRLHVDMGTALPGSDLDLGGGDVIPDADVLNFFQEEPYVPGGSSSGLIFSDFDDVKALHFSSDRQPAFHYAVYATQLSATATTLSVDASPGDAAIEIQSPVGRPDVGVAEVDGDRFTFTGRESLPDGRARLTGIPATGADSIEQPHTAGVRVSAAPAGLGGIGEVFGDDFIVWGPPGVGVTCETASADQLTVKGATFMHELGHNLALRHGGPDVPFTDPRFYDRMSNYKPNYVSLMNYAMTGGIRRLTGVGCAVESRRLDYSGTVLPDLDEANLSEANGIQGGEDATAYFCPGGGYPVCARGDEPIDWNCDGDLGLELDVCGQGGEPPCNVNDTWGEPPISTLGSADDWASLKLKLRDSPQYGWLVTDHGELPDGDPDAPYDVETITAELDAAAVPVSIDIKPGTDPNTVNLGSHGTVAVAIRGSAAFDATTVDPTSITLAGSTVRLKGRGTTMASVEDVDWDGYLDLLVHVETEALELSETASRAVLQATTTSGVHIRGSDLIQVVP